MEQLLADLTNHVKINKSLKGACKYLDKLDLNKVNLSKYKNFGDKTYQRNLVLKNTEVSIMILCWKPGQKSPIHNHPNQGCIMKIIKENY